MSLIPNLFSTRLGLLSDRVDNLATGIMSSAVREVDKAILNLIDTPQYQDEQAVQIVCLSLGCSRPGITHHEAALHVSAYRDGPYALDYLANELETQGYKEDFCGSIEGIRRTQPHRQFLQQLADYMVFPVLASGSDFRNHDSAANAGVYGPHVCKDCVLVFAVVGNGEVGFARYVKE